MGDRPGLDAVGVLADGGGGLAITLEVGDLDVAARETGGLVSGAGDRVSVPSDRASGVILNFATPERRP
jgi:hypothetical protein